METYLHISAECKNRPVHSWPHIWSPCLYNVFDILRNGYCKNVTCAMPLFNCPKDLWTSCGLRSFSGQLLRSSFSLLVIGNALNSSAIVHLSNGIINKFNIQMVIIITIHSPIVVWLWHNILMPLWAKHFHRFCQCLQGGRMPQQMTMYRQLYCYYTAAYSRPVQLLITATSKWSPLITNQSPRPIEFKNLGFIKFIVITSSAWHMFVQEWEISMNIRGQHWHW